MADVIVANAIENLSNTIENLGVEDLSYTRYTVTCGNTTQVSFNEKTDVFVTNENRYISVFIDGIEVNPLSTISVKQTLGFSLTVAFANAEVTVSTGVVKSEYTREKPCSVFTLPFSTYLLLSCRKNIVLMSKGTTIYISEDNGRTIAKTFNTGLDATTKYISFGKISDTNANKMVVFSNKGDVLYSIDGGETWTTADLETARGETAVLPPFYNGCIWIGNYILFAEYGTTANRPYRVFRSGDNGATWSVVLSKENPSDIRHWHHIDYMRYSQKIILTSGDQNEQVRWFISSDGGVTWVEVDGVNNQIYSQRYRTCRIQEIAYNRIMWGSDAVSRICEICTADLSDIVGSTEVIFNTAKTIFGICVNGSDILALTDTESSDFADNNASVYCSRDCGKTWERILEYQVQGSAGGFKATVGVDDLGEFLIPTQNNGTNYWAIAVKPN